jgi:hypothetical protein
MDCLTASNQFSRGELQDINRCRIYMRAFFISDIMNIQGTLIEPWALSGEEANDKNVSLGMASPTETNNLEGMEGRSRVPSTGKNGNSSPRHMDQGA